MKCVYGGAVFVICCLMVYSVQALSCPRIDQVCKDKGVVVSHVIYLQLVIWLQVNSAFDCLQADKGLFEQVLVSIVPAPHWHCQMKR